MEENNTSQQSSRKKNRTMIGFIVQSTLVILLISIAAWLILIVWFSGKILLEGHLVTRNTVDTMVNYHYRFISEHYLPMTGSAVYQTKKFNSFISYYSSMPFEWINNSLPSVNADKAMTSQGSIQDVSRMLLSTLEITLTRLVIFMMSLPFFFTLLFVFIVDGLGQRDIRKFQGSRESTFFFHWIKPVTGKIFFILFFIYMSIPITISPTIIMMPMIVISSLMMMLSIKSYKKYL